MSLAHVLQIYMKYILQSPVKRPAPRITMRPSDLRSALKTNHLTKPFFYST